MIKDSEIKNSITTHGEIAIIFFAIKAENVPLKDAIATRDEFERFVARVTGNTLTARHSETRGLLWEDNEEAVIEAAPDWRTAWKQYQTVFPESKRNKDSVRKKWWFMHPKKVVQNKGPVIPPAPIAPVLKAKFNPPGTSEKKPAPVKKYKTKADHQIPFSSTKERAAYQRAMKLCKKYGLPYPEALVKHEVIKTKVEKPAPAEKAIEKKPLKKVAWSGKKTKAQGPMRPGNSKPNKYGIPRELHRTDHKEYSRLFSLCRYNGIMYEEAVKQPKIVHGHRKKQGRLRFHQPHPDKVTTESPQSDPAVPVESPLAPQSEAPVSDIITGVHVRQVRPDAGRQIFGTGVVVARHGELCSVRNGSGKVYKILAACLELVNSPEKTAEKPAGEAA